MEARINSTEQECRTILRTCRELFAKKLHDYGAAWRILRPESLTDQIYIKAERIRGIQMRGHAAVDEGIEPEFIGIVNYGLIGMIQLERGAVSSPDMSVEEALEAYDRCAEKTLQLMLAKNHDYGEVWRNMRVTSMTDLILSKIHRTKQIEDLQGETFVSEGVEANSHRFSALLQRVPRLLRWRFPSCCVAPSSCSGLSCLWGCTASSALVSPCSSCW